MRKILLLAFALLLTFGAFAQDTLLVDRFKQLYEEKNDRRIDSIANALVPDFAAFLRVNTPVGFDFSRLPHVGVQVSPDNAFRLYMYNVIYRDGTSRHFGFIQVPEGNGQRVIVLNDKREEYKNPNTDRGDADKWYGALYYQIVPKKVDGKTLYTLLGNSYNDLFTTRKVADVMELMPDGVLFGEPIFFDGKRKASRIIFEYSSRITMTLKYFPDIDQIVFDHLVSSEPDSKDLQFYGPDGSQDSFKLEKGLWTLKQDIDFKRPKAKKVKKVEVKTFK